MHGDPGGQTPFAFGTSALTDYPDSASSERESRDVDTRHRDSNVSTVLSFSRQSSRLCFVKGRSESAPPSPSHRNKWSGKTTTSAGLGATEPLPASCGSQSGLESRIFQVMPSCAAFLSAHFCMLNLLLMDTIGQPESRIDGVFIPRAADTI